MGGDEEVLTSVLEKVRWRIRQLDLQHARLYSLLLTADRRPSQARRRAELQVIKEFKSIDMLVVNRKRPTTPEEEQEISNINKKVIILDLDTYQVQEEDESE